MRAAAPRRRRVRLGVLEARVPRAAPRLPLGARARAALRRAEARREPRRPHRDRARRVALDHRPGARARWCIACARSADAILVGSGTALADDPELTARRGGRVVHRPRARPGRLAPARAAAARALPRRARGAILGALRAASPRRRAGARARGGGARVLLGAAARRPARPARGAARAGAARASRRCWSRAAAGSPRRCCARVWWTSCTGSSRRGCWAATAGRARPLALARLAGAPRSAVAGARASATISCCARRSARGGARAMRTWRELAPTRAQPALRGRGLALQPPGLGAPARGLRRASSRARRRRRRRPRGLGARRLRDPARGARARRERPLRCPRDPRRRDPRRTRRTSTTSAAASPTACARPMRDTGVPVAFGVLTTDDLEQALARAGGERGQQGRRGGARGDRDGAPAALRRRAARRRGGAVSAAAARRATGTSRQAALQVLYALDIAGGGARAPHRRREESFERVAAHFELPEGARAFAKELVLGVAAHRDALDARSPRTRSTGASSAWPRSIATCCASPPTSSLHGDTPAAVIDEAVELARRFGGDRSPAFVNGVLDALARGARRGSCTPRRGARDGGPRVSRRERRARDRARDGPARARARRRRGRRASSRTTGRCAGRRAAPTGACAAGSRGCSRTGGSRAQPATPCCCRAPAGSRAACCWCSAWARRLRCGAGRAAASRATP